MKSDKIGCEESIEEAIDLIEESDHINKVYLKGMHRGKVITITVGDDWS